MSTLVKLVLCLCRFFIKEGVVHAIDELASSAAGEEETPALQPAAVPAEAPRRVTRARSKVRPKPVPGSMSVLLRHATKRVIRPHLSLYSHICTQLWVQKSPNNAFERGGSLPYPQEGAALCQKLQCEVLLLKERLPRCGHCTRSLRLVIQEPDVEAEEAAVAAVRDAARRVHEAAAARPPSVAELRAIQARCAISLSTLGSLMPADLTSRASTC